MDDRARLLLRDQPLAGVRRPRARTHHARQFRLPTVLGGVTVAAGTPLSADPPSPRGSARCRPSPEPVPPPPAEPARFRDRTLTWFQEGDELTSEPAPPAQPRRHRWLAAVGLLVAVLVAIAL